MIRILTSLAALSLAASSAVAAPKPVKPPVGKVKLPVLSYTVNASGPVSGEKAKRRDEVTVEYKLNLLDGKLIDESTGGPATFPLNRLIPAWQVLVQQMRPGDDWTFYVPPEYAYGAVDNNEIPANSFLIFRVKLISAKAAE